MPCWNCQHAVLNWLPRWCALSAACWRNACVKLSSRAGVLMLAPTWRYGRSVWAQESQPEFYQHWFSCKPFLWQGASPSTACNRRQSILGEKQGIKFGKCFFAHLLAWRRLNILVFDTVGAQGKPSVGWSMGTPLSFFWDPILASSSGLPAGLCRSWSHIFPAGGRQCTKQLIACGPKPDKTGGSKKKKRENTRAESLEKRKNFDTEFNKSLGRLEELLHVLKQDNARKHSTQLPAMHAELRSLE